MLFLLLSDNHQDAIQSTCQGVAVSRKNWRIVDYEKSGGRYRGSISRGAVRGRKMRSFCRKPRDDTLGAHLPELFQSCTRPEVTICAAAVMVGSYEVIE